MPVLLRLSLATLLLARAALAAAPPPLAAALQKLRDQKSYSWEIINSDPGPVAQRLETRRGTVTAVQQNTSPHVKAQIDRNGVLELQRDWADGLQLDTIVSADGTMITKTPEGWMTDREILGALAEERLKNAGATPRNVWLRRADRPDVRRPDEELVPLLNFDDIEAAGDSYIAHARIHGDGSKASDEDDGQPVYDVTMTLNLSGGVVRDYEVKLAGTRRAPGRIRTPLQVNDQRIVVITYLPISKIVIPPEAQEKLAAAKLPPVRRDEKQE
jgi:hypothetical protein